MLESYLKGTKRKEKARPWDDAGKARKVAIFNYPRSRVTLLTLTLIGRPTTSNFHERDLKKRGLQPLANVRIRGKIAREEWPKIAARFQRGETLTEIARSYGCTAPAIRYIIGRTPMRGANGKGMLANDKPEKLSVLVPPSGARRAVRAGVLDGPGAGKERDDASSASPTRDIWDRVNTDIATFLAAMDSLVSDDSDAHYEALLGATDRLLWAGARTRLEVERILSSRRRQGAIRRASG